MIVVSKEDIRVATTWGAVIIFSAGVEMEVADEIGVLAMQMGAKVVSDSKPVEVTTEPEEVVTQEEISIQVQPDALLAELIQICTDLIDEGDPENFNIDGTPKAKIINALADTKVTSELREQAWAEALNI